MSNLPPLAVPVAPVPFGFFVLQAKMSDGSMFVVLLIDTQTGREFWYMPPAAAVDMGKALIEKGEAGDVILAPSSPMPPAPSPNRILPFRLRD